MNDPVQLFGVKLLGRLDRDAAQGDPDARLHRSASSSSARSSSGWSAAVDAQAAARAPARSGCGRRSTSSPRRCSCSVSCPSGSTTRRASPRASAWCRRAWRSRCRRWSRRSRATSSSSAAASSPSASASRWAACEATSSRSASSRRRSWRWATRARRATTVWVRGRQYTGRIVTVTNDKIFEEPIYNATREFPFLWDEIQIPITYASDRQRAEAILLEVAAARDRGHPARGRAIPHAAERRVPPRPRDARAARLLPDHRQLARAQPALSLAGSRHARGQGPHRARHPRRASTRRASGSRARRSTSWRSPGARARARRRAEGRPGRG